LEIIKESALSKRIAKWDLIITEIHEDLKYLHEEFDSVYQAIKKLELKNEGMEGQSRK